jgi:hypothetical protein
MDTVCVCVCVCVCVDLCAAHTIWNVPLRPTPSVLWILGVKQVVCVCVELCATHTFWNGAALSTGTHLLYYLAEIVITVTLLVHSWI